MPWLAPAAYQPPEQKVRIADKSVVICRVIRPGCPALTMGGPAKLSRLVTTSTNFAPAIPIVVVCCNRCTRCE